MEEKLSCYVFLRTTDVIEVTQEITNTGIIPLEALRAHLSKGLTIGLACVTVLHMKRLSITLKTITHVI